MIIIQTAFSMSYNKNIFVWVLQKKVYVPFNSMYIYILIFYVYLENYDKPYIIIYC